MVTRSTDSDERDAVIPPLEGWIVASDAAEQLGLTRQSINKKIKAGVFPGARRIGSQYVLPEEEVDAEQERRDEHGEEVIEG